MLHARGRLSPERVSLQSILDVHSSHAAFRTVSPATARWLVETLTGDGMPAAERHELTAELFAAACRASSVLLLELLRERGCPCDESAWKVAVQVGSVALLDRLHGMGCPSR
jgi:hypothetical protein